MRKTFEELIGKKENYTKLVTRPYPPLLLSQLFEGIVQDENFLYYYPNISANTSQWSVGADVYYFARDTVRLSEELLVFYTNKENFELVKKKWEQTEEELLNAAQGDNYALYVRKVGLYNPAFNIICMQDLLFEKLHTSLKEVSNSETADRLMDTLNLPLKLNYYREEEYNLVTTDNIKEHVKKYEWIHSRYGQIDMYASEEAKQRKNEINTEEYLREFEENQKKIRTCIREAKTLLGENQAFLIDVMQWLVWFRTQRSDFIARVTYLFHDQYKKLATKLGVTYEQLLCMTTKETLEGTVPSPEELEARSKGYALYLDREQQYVYVNEEYKRAKEFMNEDVGNLKDVQGTIASAGHAKGEVKVLHGKEDLEKVFEGDIIVATMTTPIMVPAMKKAAAFVTDEGGITCHAAIISREMKKPCIIGTKIATQVLQDGDEVEVDADNGVVKILN